ncbi:hypothetical protein POVWA1_001770 [Plasmodium ovale wallikeri]|uniref:Uncharacterized protein n=1 Tax=Plasmodium ovale wallikeri TaxID=864142 RepID=A0A1A8YG44_PLAOA|nr:hypothetical protein POVWA1_001770 [Plasmodium ovale wallikeri]
MKTPRYCAKKRNTELALEKGELILLSSGDTHTFAEPLKFLYISANISRCAAHKQEVGISRCKKRTLGICEQGILKSLRREIRKTVATSLAPNWRCKRVLQLSCSVLPTMNGKEWPSSPASKAKRPIEQLSLNSGALRKAGACAGNSQNLSLKTEKMVRCKTAKPVGHKKVKCNDGKNTA